ncbi:hypothetical protein QC762_106885 [Podospora pseudocomata]|uniref:Uncharacterized protein n=1 Tax=Podospora pseudocomata TaxID=2093779 RepID=A0ABR0GTN2_9PEZI|nr:hypothetical protein QC762_106885 [Podospora pseudocomata]
MNVSGESHHPLDRFSNVSSLYGPGNMGGWLCILLSLFVTWTFNPKYSRSNTISPDFIIALTIPAVAAGHVYNLIFFQAPSSSTSSLKTLLTSSDISSQQFSSALEAPLTVCETFSGFGLALFGLATWKGQMKRALIVLVVTAFTWLPEWAILIKTGWNVPIDESNMVRPFCHNFDVPVITGIMTTLIVAVALAVLSQITSLASHQCDILFNASSSNATQERIPLHTIQKWLDLARVKLALTVKGWFDAIWPVISIPFLVIQVAIIILGGATETKYMSSNQSLALRLSMALPKSSYKIDELDQAVCLFLGHVTLVFSLWDALKGSLKERVAAHRIRGEQEENE